MRLKANILVRSWITELWWTKFKELCRLHRWTSVSKLFNSLFCFWWPYTWWVITLARIAKWKKTNLKHRFYTCDAWQVWIVPVWKAEPSAGGSAWRAGWPRPRWGSDCRRWCAPESSEEAYHVCPLGRNAVDERSNRHIPTDQWRHFNGVLEQSMFFNGWITRHNYLDCVETSHTLSAKIMSP